MAFNISKNLAQSSLASGYTAGGSSITVQSGDGSKFDAANFVVAIGNPPQYFLEVTAKSGDTFTVNTSGFDGSTPVSVASGTQVTEVITAGVFQDLLSAAGAITFGAIASLPGTVPVSGTLYICTDSPYSFLSNGSAWLAFVFGNPVTRPLLANFTQVNAGLTTFTTSGGGIGMLSTVASGDNVQWCSQALPSAPYFIDIAFNIAMGGNTGNFGLGVSDGTKLSMITFGWESGTPNWVKRVQFNNQTSFNNNAAAGGITVWNSPMVWLRIQDDGTHLTYFYSPDGIVWIQVIQEARAAFLTPSVAIFGIDPVSVGVYAHLWHFSIHT